MGKINRGGFLFHPIRKWYIKYLKKRVVSCNGISEQKGGWKDKFSPKRWSRMVFLDQKMDGGHF